MISTAPATVGRYRTNTATMTPYSWVRKRCNCGKVVTAKQLERYGACDPCIKASASK